MHSMRWKPWCSNVRGCRQWGLSHHTPPTCPGRGAVQQEHHVTGEAGIDLLPSCRGDQSAQEAAVTA